MRATNARQHVVGLAAALLGAMFAAPPVFAQLQVVQQGDHAVFEWAPSGWAAELRYPAPPGLALADLVDATAIEEGGLASFGSSSAPRELLFSIDPPLATENFVVRYLLRDGGETRLGLGALEIVEVEVQGERDLVHSRSITAPSGGLYLAAAVDNISDTAVDLRSVHYLPKPYRTGRLLLTVTDDPAAALADVAETFTPGNSDAWDRGIEERPNPPVEGFELVEPAGLGQVLRPGEAVVLVWTDDAFDGDDPPRTFSLRPVLEYTLQDGRPETIGLPVPARSPATGNAARWTWDEPR